MAKHRDTDTDETKAQAEQTDAQKTKAAEADAKARAQEGERMVQVRFTESVTTEEQTPQTFAADATVTLPESSARHWINRRKAVAVNEEDRDLHRPLEIHDAAARLPKVKAPAPGGRQVPEPVTARDVRADARTTAETERAAHRR